MDSEDNKQQDDKGATGDNANDGGNKSEKTFTQAELNAAIDERLKRERAKSEKDAQKVRDDAAAEAAKKNGEWQTLAEQREARVKELEALQPTLEQTQAERDAMKAALEDVVKAERKDLPAHITALLDKLPLLEQREWLAKNKAELMKTASGGTPKPSPKNNLGDKGGQPASGGRSTVRL